MSSPLESPGFGTLFVGDTKDDDAQIIDALVQEVDTPAIPVQEPINPVPLVRPKDYARLLAGAIVLDSSYLTPIQIVPSDKNRIELRIDVFSFAAVPGQNDYIFLGDENGKPGTTSSWRLRPGATGKSHTFAYYTGALWVLPNPAITAAIEISFVATTS